MAAVAALLFTGVSVQQANGELDNRRKELEIAQEGQVTERFTTAVGQLGDKSPDVQLGGIYGLQRIMKDSPRDQPAVIDILSAFVRTHAVKSKTHPRVGAPADVQAAVSVLVNRDEREDGPARVDLGGAVLSAANLHRTVDERGVPLAGAVLNAANLFGADLWEADLAGAKMGGVDLRHADLREADLHGAYLETAVLGSADLTGANLDGAFLVGADLGGTDLRETTGLTVEALIWADPPEKDYPPDLPPKLAKDPRVKKWLAGKGPQPAPA
ncbi:pentapeptide repeat-containing protein [Streptomyces sp. NBC_00878]|uniref:pentapeptide repeat-containing protein n=1 Tax=Streptomyces sp. NBC_00878 TaxID=2975854 RepID=UPI002252C6A8|nr:pentapeptide repeat-containing protein [Streptomyces sp. NBC_00878]MCX4902771.1 pentapeptide repeat-containing protein [Streptomyces sp. NBC_00878]